MCLNEYPCLTKLSSTFSRIRHSDCHACARMISGDVAASSASAPNNARGREGFGSPGWLRGACGANVSCRKTRLQKRTWRDCCPSWSFRCHMSIGQRKLQEGQQSLHVLFRKCVFRQGLLWLLQWHRLSNVREPAADCLEHRFKHDHAKRQVFCRNAVCLKPA